MYNEIAVRSKKSEGLVGRIRDKHDGDRLFERVWDSYRGRYSYGSSYVSDLLARIRTEYNEEQKGNVFRAIDPKDFTAFQLAAFFQKAQYKPDANGEDAGIDASKAFARTVLTEAGVSADMISRTEDFIDLTKRMGERLSDNETSPAEKLYLDMNTSLSAEPERDFFMHDQLLSNDNPHLSYQQYVQLSIQKLEAMLERLDEGKLFYTSEMKKKYAQRVKENLTQRIEFLKRIDFNLVEQLIKSPAGLVEQSYPVIKGTKRILAHLSSLSGDRLIYLGGTKVIPAEHLRDYQIPKGPGSKIYLLPNGDVLFEEGVKDMFKPGDLAMVHDNAKIDGGIDLKQINIRGKDKRIIMYFDPAQLTAFTHNFNGFIPQIISIVYILDPLPLLQ